MNNNRFNKKLTTLPKKCKKFWQIHFTYIQPRIWSIWPCIPNDLISDKCLLCKLTITQDIWSNSDNLGSLRALVPKGKMLTELFQVLVHLHQQRERKISLPPPYEPPPSYIQVCNKPLFCFQSFGLELLSIFIGPIGSNLCLLLSYTAFFRKYNSVKHTSGGRHSARIIGTWRF